MNQLESYTKEQATRLFPDWWDRNRKRYPGASPEKAIENIKKHANPIYSLPGYFHEVCSNLMPGKTFGFVEGRDELVETPHETHVKLPTAQRSIYLGRSRSKIMKLIAAKEIKAFKRKGEWRIYTSSIREFLAREQSSRAN